MADSYTNFWELLNADKWSSAKAKIAELSGNQRSRAQSAYEKRFAESKATTSTSDTSSTAAATSNVAASAKSYLGTLEQINIDLIKNNANFAANAQAQANVSVKLAELQGKSADLGLRLGELGIAYINLSKALASRVLPGFDKTAISLTKQVKIWDRLGIGVGVSTKHINLFHTVLGKTVGETVRTGRVFNEFARATGQDFARVWGDFGTNAERFLHIVDSNAMVRTGLVMQQRARAMGTSIGSVMTLLDKFETMDGAQQTGARLNTTLTALGGSFDAVKASSMDYAERQEYLATSLQSVFPRIQAAGPRAARLYMKSIMGATNMSAQDLQAMMRWKPGQELPGATKGAPFGAQSAADERRQAAAATTFASKGAASAEAIKSMGLVASAATGILNFPRALRQASETLGTALGTLTTAGTVGAKLGGAEIRKALESDPLFISFNKMFGDGGTLTQMTSTLQSFNKQQRDGNIDMATWQKAVTKHLGDLTIIVQKIR